jgi:hypothetical protein
VPTYEWVVDEENVDELMVWPGCICCLEHEGRTGEHDPCDYGDASAYNFGCYYYPAWSRGFPDAAPRGRARELGRRAERRRGDYPPEYRSRRGRGQCISRHAPSGNCPRSCPCRATGRDRVTFDLEYDLYDYVDGQETTDRTGVVITVFVDGYPNEYLTEHAQDHYNRQGDGIHWRRRFRETELFTRELFEVTERSRTAPSVGERARFAGLRWQMISTGRRQNA